MKNLLIAVLVSMTFVACSNKSEIKIEALRPIIPKGFTNTVASPTDISLLTPEHFLKIWTITGGSFSIEVATFMGIAELLNNIQLNKFEVPAHVINEYSNARNQIEELKNNNKLTKLDIQILDGWYDLIDSSKIKSKNKYHNDIKNGLKKLSIEIVKN